MSILIELHNSKGDPLVIRGVHIEAIEEEDPFHRVYFSSGNSLLIKENIAQVHNLLYKEWVEIQQSGPHSVGKIIK